MNKHQSRTRETRAAEAIFVRDGYAAADLAEIAAAAGRTKGSIYAQFTGKEDIFMALVEEQALRYRSEMEDALAGTTSLVQNRQAFRALCLRIAANTTWNMLMLEFKLFAIRNPTAHSRYRLFLARMISPDDEARLIRLLGDEPAGPAALPRATGVQIMQTLLSAVSLESVFDPQRMGTTQIVLAAGRLFDAIVPPAAPAAAPARPAAKLQQPRTRKKAKPATQRRPS